MDRARLLAGSRPRFPPGKTRLLQLGEPLGRRAAATVGISHGGLIADVACARRPPVGSDARRRRYNYLGDTAGAGLAAPAGLAAVCGGLTPVSSTSKIKVELGAISGPTLRSPYARFGGTKN
jgi:hypothetical protein